MESPVAWLKVENYVSVKDHVESIEAGFREEALEGLMEEVEEATARKEWGGRLAIGALAAIQEKGKVRVIHDGTHGVEVNHRIKVKDFVPCPGPADKRELLAETKLREEIGYSLPSL